VLFGIVLLAYLLVTVGVAFRSPILSIDTDLVDLHLKHNHPEWRLWVKAMVIFGQRGPATLFFLPLFLWKTWKTRSTRPLVLLGTALILLNVSVGIVKIATGRIGPLRTTNAHDVFVGGNIYPSGHVSNTVVLYGLIAFIALTHRRAAVAVAVLLSVAVGLGTIYLDTHWFSDVLGGWLAGALVLLALPTVMPAAQRGVDAVVARTRQRFGRQRTTQPVTSPSHPEPAAGRATAGATATHPAATSAPAARATTALRSAPAGSCAAPSRPTAGSRDRRVVSPAVSRAR
jgi:undecaprenyl-diphosphatase